MSTVIIGLLVKFVNPIFFFYGFWQIVSQCYGYTKIGKFPAISNGAVDMVTNDVIRLLNNKLKRDSKLVSTI